jgi:hypothetical protein
MIVLLRKKIIDLLKLLSRLDTPDQTVIIMFAGLGDFLLVSNYLKQICNKDEKLILICKKGIGISEYANHMQCFKEIIKYENNYINRLSVVSKLFKIKSQKVITLPVQRHILTDIYNLSVNSRVHIFPDTNIGCNSFFLKRIVDKTSKLVNISSVLEIDRYKEYLYKCGYTYLENLKYRINEKYDNNSKSVCIFPGASGSKHKCWNIENFTWVINKLSEKYDLSFYILGTAEEENLFYLIKNKIHRNVNIINLFGKLNIIEVKKYVQKSRFIISNDSGGAHLSIISNIPTIVIAGAWEYGRFYPNHNLNNIHKVEIINSDMLECINCRITPLICPYEKNGSALCIDLVDKNKVYEDCLNIMKGNIYEDF